MKQVRISNLSVVLLGKFNIIRKRRRIICLVALSVSIYLLHIIYESSGENENFESQSYFECKFLIPAIQDSWYKPRILSSPVTSNDFENCASLTSRNSAAVLINNTCRSNIEIFSSCKATSITLVVPNLADTGGIRFMLNTSHNFGVVEVPGLGLERRDFSNDKKRTNSMAHWGEGAKRLKFELRPIHSLCGYHLPGLTYLVRAYHMKNLGHFYETIFRLFLELNSRSDLMSVQQINSRKGGKGRSSRVLGSQP